jgi:hypothetical protein
MANLILRLRALANAGTAEHTIANGGESFFSDNHLQDILDANVTFMRNEPLRWIPEAVGGGVSEWHDCKTGWRDFEEASSGSANWTVRDGLGAIQGTAGYTPNYIDGIIRFTTNQAGTAYYLTARSYDLYGAAADLWLRRQAFYANGYQFQGDGQSFARQQAFDHALNMETRMRAQAGQNRQRGSMRSNTFVRTDITGRD